MTTTNTDLLPDVFTVRIRFEDPDELAMRIRAWDLDFHQLDRGEFTGEVIQVGDVGTQVSRARFSRQIDQYGSTPPGLRTFGIPASPELRLNWFGFAVAAEDLLVFPTSRELRSVSSPGFDVFTLSISEERIEEAARCMGVSVPMGAAGPTIVRPAVSTMSRLRMRLHAVVAGSGYTAELLKQVIPQALVMAWSTNEVNTRSPRVNRLRVAEQARLAIEKHLMSGITIAYLSREIGVSERMLQAGFWGRLPDQSQSVPSGTPTERIELGPPPITESHTQGR